MEAGESREEVKRRKPVCAGEAVRQGLSGGGGCGDVGGGGVGRSAGGGGGAGSRDGSVRESEAAAVWVRLVGTVGALVASRVSENAATNANARPALRATPIDRLGEGGDFGEMIEMNQLLL